MYIAILGRQPALGAAELERLHSPEQTSWYSHDTMLVETDSFDFNRLGGSQKAGRIILRTPGSDWPTLSKKIVQHYAKLWATHDGKITLGISVYGLKATTRDIQKTGLVLKKQLRDAGVSLRLIPNAAPAHNTAVSHHNKLGLAPNKVELLVVRGRDGSICIAESVGAQNITAIAARDQARPYTDAFVGMLPPKLARMMVNLAVGTMPPSAATRVLDPFCGTGVVLQEALLLGYNTYGTDLSEKMVDYSQRNLAWLRGNYPHLPDSAFVTHGDAMTHTWQPPIHALASEAYLGQPFSAPPSSAKLTEVRGNCNHIISSFLKNLAPQIASGTPICLAVPAWRSTSGQFTHLPLVADIEQLGYTRLHLQHVAPTDLLYYRETQVVARELLLLKRA